MINKVSKSQIAFVPKVHLKGSCHRSELIFPYKQYHPVSSVPGLIPESLCNTCAVKHCSSRLPDYQSLKGLQRSSS